MEEINVILEWWNQTGYNSEAISDILNAYSKMAGHTATHAQRVAQMRLDYQRASQDRKRKYYEHCALYLDKGLPVSKSDVLANADIDEYRSAEGECEGQKDAGMTLLNAYFSVLDAMRTRVSHLKREYELSKASN